MPTWSAKSRAILSVSEATPAISTFPRRRMASVWVRPMNPVPKTAVLIFLIEKSLYHGAAIYSVGHELERHPAPPLFFCSPGLGAMHPLVAQLLPASYRGEEARLRN